MFRLALLAVVLSLSLFANTHQEKALYPEGKQPCRATIRHIENAGIGYKTGYTTLEVFLSADPSWWKVTPFLDVRGHVFDNGKLACNAGVGIRMLSGCRVYGLNTYWDYRHTKHWHYNQVGFGFETLGVRWDFRLNGYLPVGKKVSHPYDTQQTSSVGFEGFQGHNAILLTNTYTVNKVEYAMKGLDAEAAFHILKKKNIDFYAAAGPYVYQYKNKHAFGGRVRLSAKIFKYLYLDLINTYDSRFHEHLQGSVGINIPFGPKLKLSEKPRFSSCKDNYYLAWRMLQDVDRQEIVVVDRFYHRQSTQEQSVAINPATGLPYFFVFVDNTSSSDGTYESPYPTLAEAQDNSLPDNIIYVFPGDGTTTGMDSGIALQANQKLWGSGISYSIPTSQGTILIPAQSNLSPTITNQNINTEGNAITLATNNAISGVNIIAALNDAIYGLDPQSLEVSSCTFENSSTFAIEASFASDTSISLMNNQFLNNTNGVSLTFNGTSTVVCSDNTFYRQTSRSAIPIEISANSNVINVNIENNVFNENTTGSLHFSLTDVIDANINVLNNTITNNTSGDLAAEGSSLVILPSGTTDNCSIVLTGNTFSGNSSNSLYVNASGAFTACDITASNNTVSNNEGSALSFGSACTTFTLNATNNTITTLNDNGIVTGGTTPFETANITISQNTIKDIGNQQSAIDLAQGSSTLNLIAENNIISGCTGSGILCYANSGFTNMTANIIGNVINNCQNQSSNAASGISLDTYVNLTSIIANNSLSDNTTLSPAIGVGIFTNPNPTVCLTLTGNSSDQGYVLTNPGSAAFNLSPCNVDSVNVGTISSSAVTAVQSCPDATPCSP